MAGAYTRHSPRCNSSLGKEDELVGGPPEALTKGSNTLTLFLAVSWAQTPANALAPTPAPLRGTYTDIYMQRATKLALKLFI